MGRLRPWVACFVLAAHAAGAAPAFAAPSDIANAEGLFQRAKALMAKKKYAEACPMLEESYRLDRAMGTLLNLALCHEGLGRTASAWGEFKAVEQQALAASPPREDRAKLARTHAARLEPKLSRVKVTVDAPVTGLVLKVDGEEKGEPLWRSGITVDPGRRAIEVTAPGKKPYSTSVTVGDAATETVTIPALEDVPVEAPPPPPPAVATLDQVEEAAAKRARRTTGFIVGGLGVVTAGVGAAFGVLAIGADSDAKKCSPCAAGSPAADESNRATDRALLFANISNVAIPVGGVLLVAGALLVLTSGGSADPAPAAKKAAPRLAFGAGPGSVSLGGSW
ncbi:MAG: tetratricopeptide repeat protein [Myxococcales bacterium]|nr:tetratricopeptide repeat protein [Myxococcales bacterium]